MILRALELRVILAMETYHGFSKTFFHQVKLLCFETLASISLFRYLGNFDKIIWS